ncbi:hypothetical protein F5Y11DRAFT_366732 [Daldinia sp. FL1419]|nr:hypothetical protein F5Y11DRAFT_366732 [Daldinia sp. FL1419]
MNGTLSQRSPGASTHAPITQGSARAIVICTIFTPLSIFFVVLRLWARRITGQTIVFSDWAIVAALVLNCGQTALFFYMSIAGGVGHHIEYLETNWPAHISGLHKANAVSRIMWFTANSMVKFSILHLYVRVFLNKSFQILCYVVMGFLAATLIAFIIRIFTQCTPFEAWFDANRLATDPTVHCARVPLMYLIDPIINMIFDIAVFCLPLPQIWKLHLKPKRKMMLTGIFALGFFICIITSLRIWAITLFDPADSSYTLWLDVIWANLETSLGITNACLPLLKPLGSRLSNTIIRTSMFSNKKRTSKKVFRSGLYGSPLREGEARSNNLNTPFHEVSITTNTEPRTRQGTTTGNGSAFPSLAYGGGQSDSFNPEQEAVGIRVTVEWEVQRELSRSAP